MIVHNVHEVYSSHIPCFIVMKLREHEKLAGAEFSSRNNEI